MAAVNLNKLSCMNQNCKKFEKVGTNEIGRHGFFVTSQGRRRRLICKACDKTFSLNKGTPYYRLKKPKRTFDSVAFASVEGTSKSAIARINHLAVSTVSRWLELAAVAAKAFNDKSLSGYAIDEIQSDELKTFIGNKNKDTWVFTTIEVPSRLWPSFVVGNRSSKNTQSLFEKLIEKGVINGSKILFMNDGLQFYKSSIYKLFGPLAICAQVIKKIRKNRIVKVDEELVLGYPHHLEEALENSLYSTKINTSFVERLNLTIRQGSSYLNRRTACFSRETRCFIGHLYLLQTYYNFIKYHRSLKCGPIHITPAMEARIAKRRISFREVFSFYVFWNTSDVYIVICNRKSDRKSVSLTAFNGDGFRENIRNNCDISKFDMAA